MKFLYILEQSPCDWETIIYQNVVMTILHTKIYVTMGGKLSEPNFDILLFSNPRENVIIDFFCYYNSMYVVTYSTLLQIW